jgi:uncharacterized membrane protein
MESQTNKENKPKNIGLSILAGMGIGIGTFLLGTVLIGVLGLFLFGIIMPSCWESCPLMVIMVSPVIGGVIGIIAGIVGGLRTHKRLSETKQV